MRAMAIHFVRAVMLAGRRASRRVVAMRAVSPSPRTAAAAVVAEGSGQSHDGKRATRFVQRHK